MTIVFNAMTAAFAIMAAVVFLRTWVASRDRFFLFFAVVFATLSVHWMLLASIRVSEHSAFHYGLRLAGFVMMLVALVDKNRR